MNAPPTTPAGFRFALCADDYAMAPGVSRGIVEALEAGVLTATSVMTTSPWWPDHAGALTPYAGRADIGLHLNLTMDAPLGAMPALAPSGRLPDIGTLMRLSRRDALPSAEVADEIERQCDRFERVLRRPPDHFDGHQHVHVLGPVRSLVLAAIKKRGWKPWLRDSADAPLSILKRRNSVAKAFGLAVLARGVHRQAEDAGLGTNVGFSGFSSFDATASYQAQFARYLVAPGPLHLVMCHPGYVDDELRRLDPVLATREQELDFLLSHRFQDLLARQGATLTRLSKELALPKAPCPQ